MSVFTADQDFLVPNADRIGWLYQADAVHAAVAPYRGAVWFHPEDVYRAGAIIDQNASNTYSAGVGDQLHVTLVGRNGGKLSFLVKVGFVIPFFSPLPFVWVSADQLERHFDFDPDHPLMSDRHIRLIVHGNGTSCS